GDEGRVMGWLCHEEARHDLLCVPSRRPLAGRRVPSRRGTRRLERKGCQMKRLTRDAVTALVAAGHSPYDLALPQWVRLALALARHSPQGCTALGVQLGIPRTSRMIALKYAIAYGVVEHCGKGLYRYIADTPGECTDQLD